MLDSPSLNCAFCGYRMLGRLIHNAERLRHNATVKTTLRYSHKKQFRVETSKATSPATLCLRWAFAGKGVRRGSNRTLEDVRTRNSGFNALANVSMYHNSHRHCAHVSRAQQGVTSRGLRLFVQQTLYINSVWYKQGNCLALRLNKY